MTEELVSLTVPSSIQEFPLTEESIVLIVGGWHGNHSQFYVDTYDPHVYIFEPQAAMVAHLRTRFAGHTKVRIVGTGLGVKTGSERLSRVGTDRCSFVRRRSGFDAGESTFEGPHERAALIEMGLFMKAQDIESVDLVLMNCEGYEFFLLPHMVRVGLAARCRYIMAQFHLHHEESDRVSDIRRGLAKTHDVRDDYFPAWVVWERHDR